MSEENKKQVVIFNGPPNSGKDEACRIMESFDYNVHHQMFKEHLFYCVEMLFNINIFSFMELYNNRELKESPTHDLMGYSPRESMQFASEVVIKPNFGQDYFGIVAAENLNNGINVFSDGGFVEELKPVYDECNGNMIIIQLYRDGCNFDNDTRYYVEHFMDVPIIKLYNNGTLDDFKEKLFKIKEKFKEFDE